jgi:MFS transporter, FHS family, glucose/mannose:H+ symporter
MPQKLTQLAYLAMLIIGSTISLAGVTTPEIARTFRVDTYQIGYAVTLFTTGYSLAIYFNGFVLEKVNIKKELTCALVGMFIAVLALTAAPSLLVYALSMAFYGLSAGVLYSITYYCLAALYEGKERASKLSFNSFSFSVGSLLAPFLAGLALRQHVAWEAVYLSLIGLMAVLLLYAYRLDFSLLRRSKEQQEAAVAEKWNLAVYTSALAIFCYVAAESVVSYWVVTYSHSVIGMEIGAASFTLAIFWAFIALGRLSAGLITKRVAANHYILVTSLLGILALIAFLLWADRMEYAYPLIACAGASFSSMFALLLSFGIAQIHYISSKLMSLYMTSGAVGNIAGLFFSSYVNQHFGLPRTLLTSIVALAIVHCLTWATTYLAHKREHIDRRGDT